MRKTALDQNLTKKIKIDQRYLARSTRFLTFAEKVMEKILIKTEQMLDALKSEPDNEQEYTHYLGGILRSTHWMIYDSANDVFGDSTDWDNYEWYKEAELLDAYSGHWWRRDV